MIEIVRTGTGGINSGGYYRVSAIVNGRRVRTLEHLLVMQEHLGRELLPHEEVHHRYGDKLDNDLESLELWTKSQPAGQRVEDKLRWCRSFLTEYGFVVTGDITMPTEAPSPALDEPRSRRIPYSGKYPVRLYQLDGDLAVAQYLGPVASEPCIRGHEPGPKRCGLCSIFSWASTDMIYLCSVDWCRSPRNQRRSPHYCITHKKRLENGLPIDDPIREATGWIDECGYRRISVTENGIRRTEWNHVRVMEASIGRKLVGKESVHHRNGIKDDDRLENLELWSSAQPPGQRVEDKIAWATDYLQFYGITAFEPTGGTLVASRR